MEIKRELLLSKLKERMHNNMIKVVTGMRRVGKSYLLFHIFFDFLLSLGVKESHIIRINLEDRHFKELRDPDALLKHIDDLILDKDDYFILLDEVQYVAEFEDVLNSLLHIENADIYVTGSNAKFLSKDVITEFRGRGDEIRIHPLSFSEYMSEQKEANLEQALRDYMTYGGLPQLMAMVNPAQKEEYLKQLFTHTYIVDIKDRYHIKQDAVLEEIIDLTASMIGGLVNPSKLKNTFKSVLKKDVSFDLIKSYLEMLQDAFLIERAVRFDIKGKRYIDTPSKYYFDDLGLRNARLNFRQAEETHLLENLIYNELRYRGYSVDVGEVIVNCKNDEGKGFRQTLEVDFVCNRGFKRVYIQSALALPTIEKREQEFNSLRRIKDNFQKIVIVGGLTPTYQTEDGILVVNVFDFLLKDKFLDL